jgi:glycosyltransferase involved in cell wall biosynthesis
MKEDTRPLMVTIRCCAYNHGRYIRECLEGFVMQQTSFRFEAIIHDDASTDGTTDIIREYESKYPDIIIPIYEQENQYSKHNGSIGRIMDEHTHGKYVAICEGDDYWIDPYKLQKQFDFMEAHPECSMCFHAHKDLYPNGETIDIQPSVMKDMYAPQDVIMFKNNIIGTNTIFYRWHFVEEGRPQFWRTCPVGDIPTRLFFCSKGLIGYINESLSVYRISAVGGWTSRKTTLRQRSVHHAKIIEMYKLYDEYTENRFHNLIQQKKHQLRAIILKDWLKEPLRMIRKMIRNLAK